MKKHRFIRTMAAGVALALTMGSFGTSVFAANWGQNSAQYADTAFESEYTYAGNDLGAIWTAEATAFRVWAPTATTAQVNLYRSGVHGTRDRIDPHSPHAHEGADVCALSFSRILQNGTRRP